MPDNVLVLFLVSVAAKHVQNLMAYDTAYCSLDSVVQLGSTVKERVSYLESHEVTDGQQLKLESFEGSPGLDIQDGFFTLISDSPLLFHSQRSVLDFSQSALGL